MELATCMLGDTPKISPRRVRRVKMLGLQQPRCYVLSGLLRLN